MDKQSGLIFDADKHEYRLAGKVLPSVTQIIGAAGLVDFSRVPPERLLLAQERGTAVHKACDLHDKGTLDYASLDPLVWPYLEAWVLFRNQTGFHVDQAELPIYSIKHGYAGTFDRIGMLQDPALIDIKTSEIISQATGVQTAAYLFACDEIGMLGMPIKKYKRFALHLFDNGKYELEPYTNPQDWR